MDSVRQDVKKGAISLRKSVLLVVSGPSGAGKDTVIERLRQLEPEVAYCVTYTTRPPRQYEIDGVHYRFTTRDNFRRMAAAEEFLETRVYAGNLYGTPRAFVEEALAKGRDLILKPEVNGARALKALYNEAVLVFLTAPSEVDLLRRLEQRHADSTEEIDERLQIAQEELDALSQFDYRVVNDDISRAVCELQAILVAERLKVARLPGRSGS
jgi:guanylate kinase